MDNINQIVSHSLYESFLYDHSLVSLVARGMINCYDRRLGSQPANVFARIVFFIHSSIYVPHLCSFPCTVT